MTAGRKLMLCLAFAGALNCSAATTDMDEPANDPGLPANPYQAIADRNVFGLKPIPPPAQPELPKPPPPNIILSGITKFEGKKTAFLKTPPVPAKQGQTAKGDQYFMLSEGEMDRDMKVLEIDDAAGVVKVAYSGTEIALNFSEHGAKPMAGPLPGQPGAIPAPGMRPPGTLPPATARPIALPTRAQRTPGTAPGAIPPPATGNVQGGAAVQSDTPLQIRAAGGNLNVAPARAPLPQNLPEVHQLPPEQQFVLQEIEREQTAELVNRQIMPPLPPTPLTPPGRPGAVMPAPAMPLPH